MGSNCSSTLKNKILNNEYIERERPTNSQMTNIKAIQVSIEPNQTYHCLEKVLNTSKYSQSLQNGEEFIKKMSQQSPYICNFYFIPNINKNDQNYKFVYEYGKQGLTNHSIIFHFTSVFYSLISALEFLESINLFYPKINLFNIVYCTNDSENKLNGSYKLINQFCFDNFFDFIINIYLSPNVSEKQICEHVQKHRLSNLNDFKIIVKEILLIHPRLYDPSHQLSNILIFDKYLERINTNNFSFMNILNKFKELFNIDKNCNISYNSIQKYQHNTHHNFHSNNKYGHSSINKPEINVLGIYYSLHFSFYL